MEPASVRKIEPGVPRRVSVATTLDPTRRISAELGRLQAELHNLGQGLIRALYVAAFAIGGSLFFGAVVIASALAR